MTRILTLGVLLLLALPAIAAEPDPATVRRFGPAYRYPQHGWIVLHIEGEPYERGFQHGKLMAKEIEDFVNNLATQQSKAGPSDAWGITRTMVSALFLRQFDKEFLEEMQGIADGAADGGATFDKRPVDLLDIVTCNVQMEYETLDNAVEATPTGLEGIMFPKPGAKPAPSASKDHCSAFAATGPATADGKMVIGHITMSGLANALPCNVWLDIKPAKGHRLALQGFPGAIWSGQDYYQNSAGLVLTETTIGQTQFNREGTPLTNRCRKAMQYGSTIDDIVKALVEKNNGLYTNEWLIGDANTNEIAMLELGTNAYKLHRSSKKEWLMPGTEGFYWGCNNTKDLAVRIDTLPGLKGRPQDLSWRPADRDKVWLKLYDSHRGKVDANFGKLAFSTPPLCAIHSLDAKITTSDMAKKFESHALFGPPSGRVWEVTEKDRGKYAEVRSLIPNDWTVLTPAAPDVRKVQKQADFRDKLPKKMTDPETTAAWHGTLLPKSDNDVWLTSGFAAYERIVALEHALSDNEKGKLSNSGRERIDLALFQYKSAFLAAIASPHASVTKLTSPFQVQLDRDRWHTQQTGYGVIILNSLREIVGGDIFDKAMDEFGRAHAGQSVTVKEFIESLKNASPKGESILKELKQPIDAYDFKDVVFDNRPVNVLGWMIDPDSTIIVYGTLADVAGNKAAALELQKAFSAKWWNSDLPILADKDASDAKLKGKHVLLIGRPEVNAITKKFAAAFPVQFGPASATVNGKLYAHERTAVIVGGVNPLDAKFSAVAVAGFSADATYCAAQSLTSSPGAEILLFPRGSSAVPLVAKSKQ